MNFKDKSIFKEKKNLQAMSWKQVIKECTILLYRFLKQCFLELVTEELLRNYAIQ